MELGSDRAAHEQEVAAELAAEYPGWTVERVSGIGFEARPKGTPVIRSITIDGIKAKLERQRQQPPAEPIG
jgi:hypothetical protein